MNTQTIVSILGALGIGTLISGITSSWITLLWQRRNEDKAKHQEFKEVRYKCIILLMHAYINFDQSKEMLVKHGYDIQNKKDLTDLLQTISLKLFKFLF